VAAPGHPPGDHREGRWRLSRIAAPGGDDAPLVAAAPALALGTVFRRFWPYARPYRRWIGLSLLVALLIPLVEAAEIWMFKLVVDDVLVPRDLGPLAAIAAATVGIVVTRGILSFADEYLAAWVGERFVLDLRTHTFGQLICGTPDTMERRRLGDTLSRVTSDVDAVEGIVVSGVAEALSATVRIVVFVGILLYLDPVLAVAAVVAAPLLWALAARCGRLVRRASRESRRRAGALGSIGEEGLANAALVQAHGLEDAETRRFRDQGRGLLRAELAAARVRAIFGPLVDLIELGAALLVIGLGTWAVAEGRLTLGGLLVFLAYVTQLYAPVRELGSLATSAFSAAAAAERVADVLDERPLVEDPTEPREPSEVRGHVVLEGVRFAYPGAPRPVMDGADLEVAPGETVAIVGDNGAGKSTLAKLLLRFHDPERGAVRLDGVDLREMRLATVRRHVTVLLQEHPLVHGTVRENIALGDPGADDAAIMAAVRAAGAHRVIAALPDGLDTVVGQRGRRLSGGQRQLIAIARALLRDAPVLILDEPTSGLDAAARERLRGPLRRLLEGRTTILITHDPEALEAADRVVRLEGGRFTQTARTAA
jgi:ABC-type multidrug transport system fused ATPase/permease subunit